MRWDALQVNRRESSPDSPQGHTSLPLALCLAVAVAALIVFAVPRIAALAQAHSRCTTPPTTEPVTQPAGRRSEPG